MLGAAGGVIVAQFGLADSNWVENVAVKRLIFCA